MVHHDFKGNFLTACSFLWICTDIQHICHSQGPFTRCGSGNVGVGVFHCVAAESVHTIVLHVAAATAVIAAKFVCFAPFTILENSMWICFDV